MRSTPSVLRPCNKRLRACTQLISEDQGPSEFSVDPHRDGGGAGRALCAPQREAYPKDSFAHEAVAADDHLMALHHAFDAFARCLDHIAWDHELEAFALCRLHEGLSHDVLGCLIEGRRDPQELVHGLARGDLDRNEPRMAVGQGPGLVDHQRANARQGLQCLSPLDQDAVLGCARQARHERDWYGQDKRTRCRHDQHRHGANGISAPGPGCSCERDGRRQKHHGVSIRQARHRRAGTLGSRDQAHDPGICALGRTPCRHQMEGFAGIGRSAQDRIPHLPPHRHGFAGQRRLVEHGGAVHDRAIDRHDVAFADNETIARLDRLQRNLLQPAVPLSEGSTRHAGQQGRHLTAGATLGKALEILTARIHHRDDGRGQVFRKQKGCEHGERGDDVQTDIAATQADDDLDHEDDKNRSRGRSPYRARPMLPSKEMRCESENQPGRGPYDEDRTKKRPHFGQGPEAPGRAGQYQIVSHTLRCLDRSEIEHKAARIFACEAECRHIGMTNHEPFAQSVAERTEIHPAIEGAERRRAGIWTLSISADGMTFRAQSLSESLAMPLQRTRLVLRGETCRCSEQQKQAGKPCHHLDFPSPHRLQPWPRWW